ncbi:golgin subfamily B member 1 isoform X2 [Mugil cephalus]|uniref:golgin subfamily B member 1 isoform X2 n=1 Tax=Mugil cephalus TaxID=48193 RepID=UPI001FB82E42|nr:golgin subfamily B member 1 isoform X2 [Mugil cephalus]
MLSRLANVLQELSGEEGPDGDQQGMLVPQLPPGEGQALGESEAPEEAMERLAHLEQLVVQLKELIRDKDTQLIQKDAELTNKDAQLKNEKDEAEARFTKLKLQAKAKMASLTKQISELKGQGGGATSPDSSFTGAGAAVEEELQELKKKLSEEEVCSKDLKERLHATEQLLQEKESTHAEQLRMLQAVVSEKDVRFQEQIQKHEEELLKVTAQSQNDAELQQVKEALRAAQQRCEELEEAVNSRSQVLEMLQQEVSSADQQKQILTAQFRQMEQELAEAVKLREEDRRLWAEQTGRADAELAALRASLEALEKERTESQESELSSLREAEHVVQEALEKEKMEVARLEKELALLKEAERASSEASERDRAEIARLEGELAAESAAVQAGQDALERERSEVDKVEKELAALREEHEEMKKKGEVLSQIWGHLRSVAVEDAPEEIPADPSLLLDAVRSVETQLTRLKDQCRESEERCAQLTHATETLQEQLDKKTTEEEEAAARIQQLEEQMVTLSDRNNVTEPSEDSAETEKAHILSLEQQLLEKDNELAALRESLIAAKKHISSEVTSDDQTQNQDTITAPLDSSAVIPDFMDDTQEEETTLVAEDTSVLSISAGNESSPELIGHQSESPEESKGTSSDEMVASSDSEVAHSSWTLLEAVNQDGGQEWPSVLQDFNQSWVATSMEQETSTVQVESSSVTIRETVQVHVTQQGSSSMDVNVSSSQVFAQALAEELQKRYSELLAELQRLKEAAAESQERIQTLEQETQSLSAAKEEAEAQASNFAEDLRSAREEMDNRSQQNSSVVEKHSMEMQLLEEQIDILTSGNKAKEQKLHALQTDLEMAQKALSEQEGQARMLSAQLEERELLSSELERRLQDMENSVLQYSQTSDLNSESLSIKDSEISELQLCLSEKEQEMMELNNSMSARLLQSEEEKFRIDSEASKLKEQIAELEKVRDEKSTFEDSAAHADDELATLRTEKEQLEKQLTNTKKKLQAALVQRKELMKKVSEFEVEAKKWKEKDEEAVGGSESTLQVEKGHELQEMETKLMELEEALRSKEEIVETLEQKISQQDQVLAETVALNMKLSKEAENTDVSAETTALQSQVSSLEAECETLQKKVHEAQESRKETIRKAKEKDRHHREQLKQQKEEYNELMERFEVQTGEHGVLLTKLREIEENMSAGREDHQEAKNMGEKLEKPAANDWAQEDWVDFAASETDSSQPQSSDPSQRPGEPTKVDSEQVEESLKALRDEIQAVKTANSELETKLQETQTSLSLKETEVLDLGKELQALREKDCQIDSLSEEINDLREKYLQAQSYAESLKTEMEAGAKTAAADSSIVTLQAEVEDFKQFLDNKNHEIMELSQQLSEQNLLIHSMQDTVSQKDQLITSLQEELKAEKEKSERFEAEAPQKQEEDSEAKIQQLQRKLQAALISRKDALKENKSQKEQLASTEKVIAELQQKIDSAEDELEKLRAERVRLIDEVDRTLLENQSLGSSCESLKLAMEGIISEKDAYKKEVELAKEEAARTCREWEEKVQGMKEEYETLLKSYENVSDEAERVRRVLEAARQERQDMASKVRATEAARQEAERQAADAQKEVDSVKDKMRKFAKTKQQKILELEEENERLREMQDKPVSKREDKALNAKVEQLQEELGALKAELDASVAERDTLGQQVEELKEQLAQMKEKGSESGEAVVEEVVSAQQSDTIMTTAEPVENKCEDKDKPLTSEETQDRPIVAVSASETHVEPTEDKETSDGAQTLLENKMREIEAALNAERELWQEREAELKAEIASLERDLQENKEKETLSVSLEKCLQESNERERSLIEEASNRETQFKELLRSLETEKDNLEERLMNQLAQLNGSIAGYQQEAADNREHLNELQRDVERLERERAELEAEAQSERDRAARLEEDMRQAQRERAEAEAESGKQRELEQQLRSAQRVKEGSQSRARQLEELLREKQLEVRQLQKDSIQYQERISELGREAKALQLSNDELLKKLQQSQLDASKTLEDLKRTEAELVTCKSQLDEAQQRASEALAAKTAIEQSVQQREATLKAEAEQTLDSVRFRLGAELKEIELRLEDAYKERDNQEEATLEAREVAEEAERRAQEMQARLDESLARLAAFSRCMSSLQDDRDRVLDEARQWETRFNGALQGKEAEVREAETRAKELAEQLQKETALKEELALSVDRLEKADKDWKLRLEEEEKKATESQAALEEEKVKLQQTTTELQSAQNEVQALQNEVESLSQRTRALEEAVGRLQGEVDQARTELREREAEERRLCLNLEQLETDLRSSKALTESLQSELNEKEKREVEMLGEKEQAVAQAAEEARKEADSRAQDAEKELEQRRSEVRDLEEKMRKAEEESNNRKARLDSFMKAMGSLQDDRDRVLNMYKQLEEKHLQVMMEKDGLIQEAAGENNSLKEELRSLLVQRDDLYAEKAKLSAQLHGYRDELNQVLSMKDSQHKQLLAAQRERIASLENKCGELENELKSLNRASEADVKAVVQRVESETLVQAAESKPTSQVRDAPGAEVEKLREQLQAAREQVEALEETLSRERREQERRSKELAELQWEGGVMRTESESAQERVAELARDLLAVEQKLLEEKEATKQLRAENQSFAKAMASLQESRDEAVNKVQELSLKLEEVSKAAGHTAQSSPAGSSGEVWGLKNALQALQNDRERLLEQLKAQTSELKKQKSELARLGAGELIKVSQELLEEKNNNKEMLAVITQLENVVEMGKQEVETLRLERMDWMAQAEQLKQQTLTTLSERDQQMRQLSAMLEEARAHKPKLQQERYQRQGTEEVDSAPGAPQERNSLVDSHAYIAEVKELQRRLDDETQQRMVAEEQLMATQDRLKRQSQAKWHSAEEGDQSETAVFIEPPEGAVTRTRRGGPGLMRMLRVAFCSRQRTPLLFSLYLLTVHVLLLLCLGGYL